MKHLYFIRHGLSVMNEQGIFSGQTETPLSPAGIAQAKAAGISLKSMLIDCIVTSPMGRTIETAQLIADVIGYPVDKIITNELFIERHFGPLEGTRYTPDLGDAEGVEPITELVDRAQHGLDFLQSLPAETILLVSHGAIGRALRHALHPDIPFKPSPGFGNGEVVQLY